MDASATDAVIPVHVYIFLQRLDRRLVHTSGTYPAFKFSIAYLCRYNSSNDKFGNIFVVLSVKFIINWYILWFFASNYKLLCVAVFKLNNVSLQVDGFSLCSYISSSDIAEYICVVMLHRNVIYHLTFTRLLYKTNLRRWNGR